MGPLGESGAPSVGKDRVMWKANTFKVVAPVYVGKGPMSWPPQASSECTDHMLEIWAQ
jgi:hypothetical protein